MYLYYEVDLVKYFVLYCSHTTFVSFWSLTNKAVLLHLRRGTDKSKLYTQLVNAFNF